MVKVIIGAPLLRARLWRRNKRAKIRVQFAIRFLGNEFDGLWVSVQDELITDANDKDFPLEIMDGNNHRITRIVPDFFDRFVYKLDLVFGEITRNVRDYP